MQSCLERCRGGTPLQRPRVSARAYVTSPVIARSSSLGSQHPWKGRVAPRVAAPPLVALPARGDAAGHRSAVACGALGLGTLGAACSKVAGWLGFGGGVKATATAAAAAAAGTGGSFAAKAAAFAAALGAAVGWWPWWGLAVVLLVGMFVGLGIAKAAANVVAREFDPNRASLENRELREKVEELQQLVVKLEPLAYKGMGLRFTKGINKAVILGMVDQMLANRDVNIWWLPDELERLIYFNTLTLMLQVLDEVVEGMSINFAGHNVKLQLTYLDVEKADQATAANAKTGVLLKKALAPVKTYDATAAAAA